MLVAGAVSISLTVQGEISPQWGGVATQSAVTTTCNKGAPLRLWQGAGSIQMLLYRL